MAKELTYPYGLKDAESPLEILDRMKTIVEAEQLVHGVYVDDNVAIGRFEAGAICGGHKFCAIGTELFAAGVPIVKTQFGELDIPSGSWERDHHEEMRPHLSEVRHALNEAAQDRIDSGDYGYCDNGLVDRATNPDALEVLFENGEFDDEEGIDGRDVLLDVIAEAAETLRGAVA